MRKLGLSLAALGLGLGLFLAWPNGDPPLPPVASPQPLPEISGRYVVTIGRGQTADTLTLSAELKPPAQVDLEFDELGATSLAALGADGRCQARFVIPADPDTESPAEVWILQGRFVVGGDSPYLEGDLRVEIEGQRNAVFRRLSSYYDGPLER